MMLLVAKYIDTLSPTGFLSIGIGIGLVLGAWILLAVIKPSLRGEILILFMIISPFSEATGLFGIPISIGIFLITFIAVYYSLLDIQYSMINFVYAIYSVCFWIYVTEPLIGEYWCILSPNFNLLDKLLIVYIIYWLLRLKKFIFYLLIEDLFKGLSYAFFLIPIVSPAMLEIPHYFLVLFPVYLDAKNDL